MKNYKIDPIKSNRVIVDLVNSTKRFNQESLAVDSIDAPRKRAFSKQRVNLSK